MTTRLLPLAEQPQHCQPLPRELVRELSTDRLLVLHLLASDRVTRPAELDRTALRCWLRLDAELLRRGTRPVWQAATLAAIWTRPPR